MPWPEGVGGGIVIYPLPSARLWFLPTSSFFIRPSRPFVDFCTFRLISQSPKKGKEATIFEADRIAIFSPTSFALPSNPPLHLPFNRLRIHFAPPLHLPLNPLRILFASRYVTPFVIPFAPSPPPLSHSSQKGQARVMNRLRREISICIVKCFTNISK